MNIWLTYNRKGLPVSTQISSPSEFIALLAILLLLLSAVCYAGYWYSNFSRPEPLYVKVWDDEFSEDRSAELGQRVWADVDAMTLKFGQLQMHLDKLHAYANKIAKSTSLDSEEFDFTYPRVDLTRLRAASSEETKSEQLKQLMSGLSESVSGYESQLVALGNLVQDRQIREQLTPAGRPVKRGWKTSGYGMRLDPIGRKRSVMHHGVDFSGRDRSAIIATADGVVTTSGSKNGFGKLLMLYHGGGYTTIYAHNDQNLVQIGDLVTKGQTIALMGSTGRSTGTHVHYEIQKNGEPIDPTPSIDDES